MSVNLVSEWASSKLRTMQLGSSSKRNIWPSFSNLIIDLIVFLQQKQFEEAQKDYKEALNSQPSALQMMGLALADSVCSTVLPALSLASVAGIAGAAMSTTELVATAGIAAYGAKSYLENKGTPDFW